MGFDFNRKDIKLDARKSPTSLVAKYNKYYQYITEKWDYKIYDNKQECESDATKLYNQHIKEFNELLEKEQSKYKEFLTSEVWVKLLNHEKKLYKDTLKQNKAISREEINEKITTFITDFKEKNYANFFKKHYTELMQSWNHNILIQFKETYDDSIDECDNLLDKKESMVGAETPNVSNISEVSMGENTKQIHDDL